MRLNLAWGRCCVQLLAIFALTTPALAYDKEVHGTLTEIALKHYRTCHPLPERVAEAIIACNMGEDNFTLSRALNWHFYQRDGKIPVIPKLGVKPKHLQTTFKSQVDHLSDLLEDQEQDADDRLKALGRLIHYLQDVTNPGHVIPVYHAKRTKDLVDNIPVDTTGLETKEFGEALCKRAKVTQTMAERIDRTAKDTLLLLTDKSTVEFDWSKFWAHRAPGDKTGWGSYVPDKKDINSGVYVTPEFRAFVRQLHTRAIAESFDALRSQAGLIGDSRLAGGAQLRMCGMKWKDLG